MFVTECSLSAECCPATTPLRYRKNSSSTPSLRRWRRAVLYRTASEADDLPSFQLAGGVASATAGVTVERLVSPLVARVSQEASSCTQARREIGA